MHANPDTSRNGDRSEKSFEIDSCDDENVSKNDFGNDDRKTIDKSIDNIPKRIERTLTPS